MTVAELIEKLKEMPQDSIVEITINAPFFEKEVKASVNKMIIKIR